MKLTREQVSQFSDVELNRAMILCYNRCADIYPIVMDNQFIYCDYKTDIWFDYLTDYNLTMPLAFERGVCLTLDEESGEWDATERCDLYAIYVNDIEWGENASNKNPLRAISEVLLMIAMEEQA